MNKLVVCIMGAGDDMRFINMCYNSVKDADEIVYLKSQEKPEVNKFLEENNIKHFYRAYEEKDICWNGRQRNFYLDYLKKNYPNQWVLCMDADEIVDEDGILKIKKFLEDDKSKPMFNVYDVHMRHFIGDLGHEDATTSMHWVPRRLFKITEDLYYPEVEHPVLLGNSFDDFHIGRCAETTIFHMAYVPNMWEIKKRYENHLKKSNMHTPEFLRNWYYVHLFGKYPKKEIDIRDIPKIIYNEFGIDRDEFYFMDRNIEIKHPVLVKQWNDYFKPESVLDLGCGKGCYLHFWSWYMKDYKGIEKSLWAVNHSYINNIICGDVIDEKNYTDTDLILAVDVLEHLTDDELNLTLKNMSKYGKRFLFSIPFDGDIDKDIPADPNLYNDKTHKQYKTKDEWIKLIECYGIKITDAPSYWTYAPQILIGEKI